MKIERFAVRTATGRIVHGRICGSGPAVVLLHGSPQWSATLVPVMQALAPRHTAIALDTPGNGCSDPLTLDDPSAEDYAAALSETLDTLGLKRVALYGYHTGAGTAVEFLKANPDRVTTLVCDGYAAFNAEERADLLAHYLPPCAVDWSGSHLAWVWARAMEQTIFFPWHEASLRARMVYTVPPPEALQASVMDFLRQGDAYIKPYRAAFKRDGIAGSANLPKPVFIGAMSFDPLCGQLDRLAPLPAGSVKTAMGTDRAAAIAMMADWLARHPADPPPPLPRPVLQGFVTTKDGAQLLWRGTDAGAGRPLVLLHDAGGSSALYAEAVAAIANRPIIALDLPGHGESGDTWPDGLSTVEDFAKAVAAALEAMSLKDAAIAGFHLGGQIALELARTRPGLCTHAGLIGAPVYNGEELSEFAVLYAPSIAPRWDGAHLLTAWHFLRLRSLFFPWFRSDGDHMIPGEPHVAPLALQRQLVDLLKCGDRYRAAYRAQFTFDTRGALLQNVRAQLFAAPWDPLMLGERWRATRPDARTVTKLPANPGDWAAALDGFAG